MGVCRPILLAARSANQRLPGCRGVLQAAIEAGARVTLTAHVSGKADAATAQAVEQVWNHFLVERCAPHVRGL